MINLCVHFVSACTFLALHMHAQYKRHSSFVTMMFFFIFIFSTDHIPSLDFSLLTWTDTVRYNSVQGLVVLANTNWILGSDWTWNKGRMWYGE